MPEFKTEKAFVLSHRRLGEKSFIVSVLTAEEGRMKGVYTHKKPPETGVWVSIRWQARLPEQLGTFYLEEINPFSIGYLDDKKRLSAILSLCSLLDELLPERQAFPTLFQALCDFLDTLDCDDFVARYALFEKTLLSEIGFGLDTSCCAGGGDKNDLAYISPKTGRAVSREKGEPYRTKLLPLPAFLWRQVPATAGDIQNAFRLLGFFLSQHTFRHNLPDARERLLGE